MRETRPSFPFYPKDWLPATRGLSAAARGFHVDMLALAWLNGGCDVAEDTLRRSVGAERAEWRKAWAELEPRWPVVDGRRVNRKLEEVRAEMTRFTEARRAAGKTGGLAKASAKQTLSKEPSKALANDVAKPYPTSASAFAKQIPPQSPKGEDALFATFWDSYPRHVGKAVAAKAFDRLKVTPSMLQAMLDALTWQRQQDGWTKDGGAFIPHPSTWLNQRRWEDEQPASVATEDDEPADDGVWYPRWKAPSSPQAPQRVPRPTPEPGSTLVVAPVGTEAGK